jgi:hypothetical protein
MLRGLGLIAMLAILVAVGVFRQRSRSRTLLLEVEHTAQRVFGTTGNAPLVELHWAYGWPAFALVFPTQEARLLNVDQGAIQEFATQLRAIVVANIKRGAAFDVNKALWVTSVPERQQWRDSAADYKRRRLKERGERAA